MAVLTDEHVPRVFITTLRSNGYEVVEATTVFGEGTDDKRLLRYCGENGLLLVTHDKKDFAGGLGEQVDHAGIVVYTDANYLRDRPENAVRTLERVLAHYPPAELHDELVWLDQWR
jgi:predicted nuclease of predicted toxin-antitoxin system